MGLMFEQDFWHTAKVIMPWGDHSVCPFSIIGDIIMTGINFQLFRHYRFISTLKRLDLTYSNRENILK